MLIEKDFRRLFPLLLAAFLVAGCQSIGMSQIGKMVPEDKRISIRSGEEQSGKQSGKWSARDVNLDYRYAWSDLGFRISGQVHYADSIVYNYALIQTFHMGVIFADAQGRVLGTDGLVTDTNNSLAPVAMTNPVTFDRLLRPPAGTVSMAFSYTGTAVDSNPDSTITSFWEYPIK